MIRTSLHPRLRLLFVTGFIAITALTITACSSDADPTATRIVPTQVPTAVPTTSPIAPTAAVDTPVPTTPVPTATAAAAVASPTVTATPGLVRETSLVDADEFESLSSRAYDLTIMLANEMSPRQSATEEELRGAMFLSNEMTGLGYMVEIQDFEVTETTSSGSLEVLPGSDGSGPSVSFSRRDGDSHRIFFLPFEPFKIGQTQGEMVFAGLGDDDDFEGVDVNGKIVVMERGTLSFEDKETNAADRGAIGLVVFNNEPRFYFGGILAEEPEIFAGGIPQADGRKLRDALDDGNEVIAELLVYPTGNGPSRNVIAELNNEIADDPVVVIGAHYDTTPWSPGANDNGSGMAAALIVAEELADDELPFDLRFVFFGSEETGLHGSNHYAGELLQTEVDRILAMVNLDVVATGELEVFGDETLTGYANSVAEEYGVDLALGEPFEWGASDYVGFDERGVPFIMFFADELDYINHPSDTVEHVDAEPLGGTVLTVLGLVDRLADSIEE
ncbi:MAG: M28 family metallopeptidase [Chloroflexi bacterium]|nr:M28 family metallopeptidase [Chloroflexota bacterium]